MENFTSNSGNSKTPASPVHSSPPSSEELEEDSGEYELPRAMQLEISQCTVIPESMVTNIIKKAEGLLADKHAITAAPLEGARMVKSISNPSHPHLIKVLKEGKVVCDENCLMWTSLKVCSHCVAVASATGCLQALGLC